ncbi:MAG: hypothetical protein NVS3B14_11270 [Ktedonobacteraceae bacterium]
MLDEILEESWTYQEIIKKGVLQERQKKQNKSKNKRVFWSV